LHFLLLMLQIFTSILWHFVFHQCSFSIRNIIGYGISKVKVGGPHVLFQIIQSLLFIFQGLVVPRLVGLLGCLLIQRLILIWNFKFSLRRCKIDHLIIILDFLISDMAQILRRIIRYKFGDFLFGSLLFHSILRLTVLWPIRSHIEMGLPQLLAILLPLLSGCYGSTHTVLDILILCHTLILGHIVAICKLWALLAIGSFNLFLSFGFNLLKFILFILDILILNCLFIEIVFLRSLIMHRVISHSEINLLYHIFNAFVGMLNRFIWVWLLSGFAQIKSKVSVIQ